MGPYRSTRVYDTWPVQGQTYDIPVRYDTIHYITCAQKLTNSHGTKQKRVLKKLKTKDRDAQKKWSSHKVRGVSFEAGRESMVGKILCVKEVGLEQEVKERERELWLPRMMS